MRARLLGKGKYTVRRRGPGQHVDGVWEAGAETTFEVTASVQAPRMSQLQTLDEGWRERLEKVAYVAEDVEFQLINGSKGLEPDVFEFKGTDYLLFGLQDLTDGPLAHQVLALMSPEVEEA